QRLDPPADRRLQARPAHGDAAQARIVAQLPVSVLEPEKVADDITPRRSERLELVHHAREVVVHRLVAAGQQAVRVIGLRNALARLVAFRQRIALHERDAREVAAQGTGGKEPAHAGSEDDGRGVTLRHAGPVGYPVTQPYQWWLGVAP